VTDLDIASSFRSTTEIVNPDTEFGKQFAKQQEKLLKAKLVASGGSSVDTAVAERVRLSIPAGRSCTHRVVWPVGDDSACCLERLRWNAVVLGELTVDLEVSAELQPAPQRAARLLLQRWARGGTFLGAFAPGHDRRLLPAAGEVKPPKVEAVIFSFSNAFSWFTAKEVELVLLRE